MHYFCQNWNKSDITTPADMELYSLTRAKISSLAPVNLKLKWGWQKI